MATVLIIGASRGIGLEAVRFALAAGHTVRALARSAERIGINHPNLRKVSADAVNQGALADALVGVDAVMQTLGLRAGPDVILKPVHLFSDATRTLVTAMKEAGVKRLISVTGFGAGDTAIEEVVSTISPYVSSWDACTTTRTSRKSSSGRADWTG